MTRSWARWLFALTPLPILAAGCGPVERPGDTVTTGSLYEEMIDMVGLTKFPEPAYRTIQYSSYDRRSRVPGGPDWFANSDGFGNEPVPGFEAVLREPDEEGIGQYLMADVAGPGALVRLWTAAIEGTVQLWLDGRSEPVYDGPANDFFHKPLDSFPQSADLHRASLERTLYQRDAAYAPIPFARRLRLVWTGDLARVHFYQLEVRKYAPGTRVVTFSPEDLSTYRETIDRVTAALADPDANLPPRSQSDARAIAVELQPGEAEDALSLEGPAALERLELKLEAPQISRALRQTVLHIHFDDHPWGQVQSPLGDFFGAAPGINPYQSLPFTVLPDGTMISRFVMPFERSLKIRLENLGNQPVAVTGSAHPVAYDWDAERSMHFRARWRVDHDLIADPAAVQDLPFLVAHGQGVYVGTTSILLNPSPIPTPYGNWWGEGDEKVFVDDDLRPSLFGTGSEDYYNYSWSSPDIFALPYCGQPRNDGPGNRGFVTNYRWHVLDPLPFAQSIRFYMELYSHERTPGLSYARIGYHYARPGVADDHTAIMPNDVRALRLPEGWMPAARMGARNSVFYQAEELLRGLRLPIQSGRLYAGERLPVWRPTARGDVLRLRVPVIAEGEYRIHFVARLDPNGGTAQVKWDGEPAQLTAGTSTVDLHRPHRTLLRNYTLRQQQLTAGTHILEYVFDGAAPGVRRPEFGIDFVWVQEVR
ncbi:MAG: DUF2961 domain-containing protein [Gemmatimonadales bacterium]|nr:DUF2961 domain-containing protein [Gemmatimonadales bacterium]NIN13210.1 DUF2961 domain-containing protein [Gemmatimonadales bacterium]NIN51488.1 DUF2961 domain-containing protein [Gemmatimonadales bacterium]NIP08952.1 DUF2961 domain-containing protein [Gemmatimonadales bacterium]NIR03740.1 DUF2961 domain-containing protein [Gemmatimonadales bacterium]